VSVFCARRAQPNDETAHPKAHDLRAFGIVLRSILHPDVEDKPVQASHRLDCEKDDKHFSPTCKAVKDLRDKFMT
jgi:hypothetical protein